MEQLFYWLGVGTGGAAVLFANWVMSPRRRWNPNKIVGRSRYVEVFRGVTHYPNEKTGAGHACNCTLVVDTRHPATAYVGKIGREPSRVVMEPVSSPGAAERMNPATA